MGVSRRALLCGLVAMPAVPVMACSAGDVVNLPARPLRIATGNAGGVYVAYGEGIAAAVRERLPMLRVVVAGTPGSVKNLRMVADGEADVAFSLADASADALIGSESFPAPLRLAALARLYDNYVHVVVHEDSPFQRISDLVGKPVSTGPEKSGTSVLAGRILETAGLRRERDVPTVSLDLEDAAKELAAGRIAALFWSGGLPTRAIQELVETTAVRLLDLTDVAATLTKNEVYARTTVPASAYGFEPITTVSVSNHLVVRTEEDSELAYQLTRLLFTERDRIEKEHQEARRLNLRSAISTYPLDLHLGAQRYYQEAKD